LACPGAFVVVGAARSVPSRQRRGAKPVAVFFDASGSLIIQATPTQPDFLLNRASVTSAEADANPADNVSYVLALSEILITAVDNLGTDLRLSFNSVIGKNYMIQTRPDAATGLWVTLLETTNPGNDHVLQITLPNAITGARQFYRVLQLP